MFERLSMEQVVQRMIRWTRGTSDQLTDFRVGSKIRTIYEAIGTVIEELYDKVFRANRILIEENIYTAMGFTKLPAAHAAGEVTFGRTTPADTDYYIPYGTVVVSSATNQRAPVAYRTTEAALLQVGTTEVNVPVVAVESGPDSNIGATEIIDFRNKPVGIDTVTNKAPISGGTQEETKDEQKVRFNQYIEGRSRGTLQSVEYGARLAVLTSEDGTVTERVEQAKALEYLPERRGEVDLYVWNGTSGASEALIEQVHRQLDGYYSESGEAYIGYKPAGCFVSVFPAKIKRVTLKLESERDETLTQADLIAQSEEVIDNYFRGLLLGQTFIQTELEARLKYIEGVRDVKLHVSTDNGETYSYGNVTAEPLEIIVPNKPTIRT